MRLCSARRTPAVTRHWCESLDATLAASVETERSTPSPTFPPRPRRRRAAAFAALKRVGGAHRRATRTTRPPPRPSATFWRATFRARRPETSGSGSWRVSPAFADGAAKPGATGFVTDEAERAEALYESRRKKPSLREPSRDERPRADRRRAGRRRSRSRRRGPRRTRSIRGTPTAGVSRRTPRTPTSRTSATRSSSTTTTRTTTTGSRFSTVSATPPPSRAGARLGPAVEDRLLAQQSPYERSPARARADAAGPR